MAQPTPNELPASFRLPSRFTRVIDDAILALVWSVGLALAGLFCFWSGALAAGAVALTIGLLVGFLATRRTTIVVGADGVAIRWLGFTQFLRYEHISTFTRHTKQRRALPARRAELSRGVMVRHDDGETYLICDDLIARDLSAAAEQRLTRHRRLSAASVTALCRDERPIAEWLLRLRGLLSAGESYRATAMTPDALWSVVENSKSKPDDRAAAAIALRSHLGDEARPRLRVAIEACASPTLRVALEAIDEANDAIEPALERLARDGAPE